VKRPFIAATSTAASALVLVGCSGSSTADARPSPTVSAATTQQYASVIAPFSTEAKSNAAALDECFTAESLECVTAKIRGQTTAIRFLSEAGSKFDPASKVYLGDPPAEIVPLVSETEAAAENVQKECEGDSTDALTFAGFAGCKNAFDDFMSALTRWQPYGG